MAWKPLETEPPLPPLDGATLIDSHCHLDLDFDADREAVLARARRAGIAHMITIGASGRFDANHTAVALAAQHAMLSATVGVHPHEAASVTDDTIDQLAALAAAPQVVAIGETGLDYHYEHSPRPAQRAAFARFIHLARRLGLPIVVHLREADDDAVAVMRAEGAAEAGGVIHCFSGDAASARRFLDLGFHISFSGIVTFKTAEALRDAARLVPRERLLVETDAPFLAPIPFRGRRNEPALIVQTAATLAAVRGDTLAALAGFTSDNARRLFRL